jgi:hypothetical protein
MTDNNKQDPWPVIGQIVSNGYRAFRVVGFDGEANPICQPLSDSFSRDSWPMLRSDLVRPKAVQS